jgi:hypothetical protein
MSPTFVSALLPPHLCLPMQLQWHAHGSPSLQPTEAERTACLGFAFADVHDSLLLSPHNVVAELYRCVGSRADSSAQLDRVHVASMRRPHSQASQEHMLCSALHRFALYSPSKSIVHWHSTSDTVSCTPCPFSLFTDRANLLMVEADSLRAKFNAQAAAMRTLRGMANGAVGGGGEAGTATMLPGTPRAMASAVEAFMSRVGGGGDAR